MNLLFKLFLTLNSTSWVIVLFGIKEQWTIKTLPSWIFSIILLIIPILLSLLSLFFAKYLSKDNLQSCLEVESVDNSFIPTYLGYFFVGLSIENWQILLFVYIIIFLFTFVAQQQYFNPIFLLFGYHFYNITTSNHTKVFIITRRKIRNASEEHFEIINRINNSAFIELRREKDESVISKD